LALATLLVWRGYGLALAALALVVFGALATPKDDRCPVLRSSPLRNEKSAREENHKLKPFESTEENLSNPMGRKSFTACFLRKTPLKCRTVELP